jgi:hypothetical protein
MAFGRLCCVIAARMHAEKEDFGDYEFQKVDAPACQRARNVFEATGHGSVGFSFGK